MAMLDLLEQIKEVEIGSVPLDGTVAWRVIEKAEPDPDPGHLQTARVSYAYRMPFPGVRCYSYEELIL